MSRESTGRGVGEEVGKRSEVLMGQGKTERGEGGLQRYLRGGGVRCSRLRLKCQALYWRSIPSLLSAPTITIIAWHFCRELMVTPHPTLPRLPSPQHHHHHHPTTITHMYPCRHKTLTCFFPLSSEYLSTGVRCGKCVESNGGQRGGRR